MPPPLQRFGGGGPNSMPGQYSQWAPHAQGHTSNLQPPQGGNPSFMNANSTMNAFANGGGLSLGQGFGGGGGGLGGGMGMLASNETQNRFNNAVQHGLNGVGEPGVKGIDKGRVRQVWAVNLEEEMKLIRALTDYYPYIAMDIEFPGLVARPIGSFRNKSDYHYQCIRANVDLLNVIQVGLTLFNEKGETIPAQRLPPSIQAAIERVSGLRNYQNNGQIPCTWQFNLKFSLKEDMYSENSITLLKNAGVDFERMEVEGIDHHELGAKLIASGLVCDEDRHWISFHGGYDFGYLTKLLYPQSLPDDEIEFDKIMKLFFPSIWDVKYLMKHASRLHQMGQLGSPPDQVTNDIIAKFEVQKSLDSLGAALNIKRVGTAHQAGSDALHCGKCFFEIRNKVFHGDIPPELNAKVWGLAIPVYSDSAGFSIPHSTPQHYHQQLQENTTPNQNSNGTYANGTPSTPNNAHAGLASTPVPTTSSGMGPLTPGGGGGAFGHFQYPK